jgi:hypothetical protein
VLDSKILVVELICREDAAAAWSAEAWSGPHAQDALQISVAASTGASIDEGEK